MALWQYNFFIVPNTDLLPERLKNLKTGDNLFEDDILWNGCLVHKSLFDPIRKFLKEGKSWSQNVVLYGDLEHNCFEVLTEANVVISVSLRIDYTLDYSNLLEGIIEFCIHNGLIILDEYYNILPMNALVIKSLIESSEQYYKLRWLTNQ